MYFEKAKDHYSIMFFTIEKYTYVKFAILDLFPLGIFYEAMKYQSKKLIIYVFQIPFMSTNQ